jgi:hypothetical protein
MQVCGLDDQNSDKSYAPLSNYLAMILIFYLHQESAPNNRANFWLGRYARYASESFIHLHLKVTTEGNQKPSFT